jgi:hypothetical protein
MSMNRLSSIIYRPSSAYTHHFLRGSGHGRRATNKFVRNFQRNTQNEPKFLSFSPKNDDHNEKRTQNKPNTNPFLA